MKGHIHCAHLTPADLHEDLLVKVLEMERQTGLEVAITRGVECPICNTESGGGSLSAHVPQNNPSGKGEAIDFHVTAGTVFIFVERMIVLGFTGIGIKRPSGKEGFCHGDIAMNSDARPRPRLWTYS